jgi:hypothetical protein
MKNLIIGLLSVLILGSAALAQQSGEEKKDAPISDMMQGMMKGEQSGEGKTERGGMGGMMRMMKMMEQCAVMMDQSADSGKAKDRPKQ